MKNLKPSQLPVKTVIGNEAPHYEDLYIKDSDGLWIDLFSGCGCCIDGERISDAGCTKDEKYYSRGGMTTTMSSDEYFTDFKVVAVPPDYVFDAVELHGPWRRESGTYSDGSASHSCKGYTCEY